jgi:heme/copper-type cytochrome/quinol oxidase subunit 2
MRAGLKMKTLLLLIMALAVVLVLSGSALGQCSMCRAALAGSNNAFFIRNFNIGVLVLLVPPVTIFCSIFVVLKRYKAADADESTVVSPESGVSEDCELETPDS